MPEQADPARDAPEIFRDRLFWLGLIAGGFFLVLTIWFNLGMDQSTYAYGAWVWKNYHLPPYSGVWDLNYPGIFIIHWLALELFGESIQGFRIFDVLVQLNCLAMIFYLGRKLSGSSVAGCLSMILYGSYYFNLGLFNTGQREGFIFWCWLWGLVLFSSGKNHPWLRAVPAGLVLGFAFLIKPFCGLAWLVFGGWFLRQEFKSGFKRAWFGLALFSFCCLLPAGLVILYYWRIGHILELYQSLVLYNLELYSAQSIPWWGWPYFTFFSIIRENPLILLGAILVIFIGLRSATRTQAPLLWILILMAVASLIAYVLQGKFYAYQRIPLLGFLAVFAGAGWAGVGAKIRSAFKGRKGMIFSGLFYGVMTLAAVVAIRPALRSFALKYAFRDLDSAYSAWMNNPADFHYSSNNYLAGKYLEALVGPEDGIEYFGPYPLALFMLKKKLPTRFPCPELILFLPASGVMTDFQEKWIREYSADVIKARPRFFLVSDVFPGQGQIFAHMASSGLKQALRDQFPELQKFLLDNYKLIAREGVIEIYELKGPGNLGRRNLPAPGSP